MTLSNSSVLGRAARLPLRLLPGRLVVPVLRGPLAGRRWIVGSATHGCWLGTYEGAMPRLFAEAVRNGNVVFDVGANVGFYTLLAAGRVRPGGRVVAFEPVTRNVKYLRRHLDLNKVENVAVHAVAVADRDGDAPFLTGENPLMGRLAKTGEQEVRVVALDEMTKAGDLSDPDVIKIDVEGAEYLVLVGALETLRRAKPIIFLSTHSDELRDQCWACLEAEGFVCEEVLDGQLIARPAHASSGCVA